MSYSEIRSSYPKGRREYGCEWCNEDILKGEKHFFRAYVFEGEFNQGRMHLERKMAKNNLFPPDIYDSIFENDEIWIVYKDESALLVNDCQLLDA